MNDRRGPDNSPPSPTIKRTWRIVTWAGVLGSTYFVLCINGAPRVKYLETLEATASDYGWIAGLGSFALVFQVVGGLLAGRLKRRRPFWMSVVILHRLVFIGVLLSPVLFFQPSQRLWWIIGVLLVHDSLAQLSVPIWMTWMSDIIPEDSVNRHWAVRQGVITATNILSMLLVAFFFSYFENAGRIILGFSIFAVFGIVLGVIDILLFFLVPEPSHEPILDVKWSKIVLQPIRDKDFRPFLVFMSYWNFALFFGAPFFSPYMITSLKMSVREVQITGAASALGVAISSRFWGLVCDTYGQKPVLQLLTACKVLTPASFLIVPIFDRLLLPYVILVMFIDGLWNSGIMVAVQGTLLKATPRRNRATYIAAANFLAVGVMGGIAPIISGKLIDWLNNRGPFAIWAIQFTGYQGTFALSALLRSFGTVFASKIREFRRIPFRVFLKILVSPNSLWTSRWVHRLQDSSTTFQKERAADRLGRLRNPLAIGGLIEALGDADQGVRRAAADALGSIGHAEATEPLALALFDRESGIQGQAARALGRIGGAESLKALLANLKNLDSEALGDTIDALGHTGHYAAILPLICLLQETKSPDIHKRISQALLELTEIESMEEVMALLVNKRPIGQSRIGG